MSKRKKEIILRLAEKLQDRLLENNTFIMADDAEKPFLHLTKYVYKDLEKNYNEDVISSCKEIECFWAPEAFSVGLQNRDGNYLILYKMNRKDYSKIEVTDFGKPRHVDEIWSMVK